MLVWMQIACGGRMARPAAQHHLFNGDTIGKHGDHHIDRPQFAGLDADRALCEQRLGLTVTNC